MTVNSPKFTPSGCSVVVMALDSAMPVTMPGSAIGSTMRIDTASRPKNRYRATANDAIVPSTSATAVAPSPALTEAASASRAPGLCHARFHHSKVSPLGGQPNVRSMLNDEISTTSSGT